MTPMRWRQTGHALGLLFSAALLSYVLSVLAARLVGLPLAHLARGWESTVARVLLGVLALEGTRLVVLLGAAFLLGPSIALRPTIAATTLVLLTYLFDALVALVLGQLPWLFGTPAVLLCRAAAAALGVWLCALVFRRRSPAPGPRG